MMDKTVIVFNDNYSQQTKVVTLSTSRYVVNRFVVNRITIYALDT